MIHYAAEAEYMRDLLVRIASSSMNDPNRHSDASAGKRLTVNVRGDTMREVFDFLHRTSPDFGWDQKFADIPGVRQ